MAMQKPKMNRKARRWAGVGALTIAAFLGSYGYAVARTTPSGSDTVANLNTAAAPASAASADGAGCACCGGGAAGGGATKAAEVAGDAQTISVDLSQGYYDPTTIELTAGIPAEITFGQGSGCLYAVQSQDLDFYEDLSAGPKTVTLPALQPGTYSFTCGMQMVSGSIVVK